MNQSINRFITFVIIFMFSIFNYGQVTISGELRQYHKTTLTFEALNLSEEEDTFLNYRMNVTFSSPTGQTFVVPAYFAADGDASESSSSSGNKWRCHINASEVGNWSYSVSFRTGTNIAVSLDASIGNAISIDGLSGDFTIQSTDKTGNDFRAKGKLQYVNESTARFDNGDYFFEVGADSPETFLEYGDFDATVGRHDFSVVASNFETGDPSWQNGKGTEIIGAVNYLVNQGMNVHYFLTMNITGDGDEAFPFPNKTDFTTYDVSKLDQWQIVFDHMYANGMALEFVLTENENNNWFEDEEGIDVRMFSDSRKLYYREMIARFGYLNVFYNIGEEANWDNAVDLYTPEQIEEAAIYIQSLTPYSDLISVHNGPAGDFSLFPNLTSLTGTSALTAISFQGNFRNFSHGHNEIITVRNLPVNDGTEWVVRYTEPFASSLPNIERWTENSLWASITAGAVGIHYYAHNGDVEEDNYTLWQNYYNRMRYAKDFLIDNTIPFWDMQNDDDGINGGIMLSDANDYFVVFLSDGGTADIDLPGTNSTFDIRWFDPRNGGSLQEGSVTTVNSGTGISLGNAPNNPNNSWVVLVTNSSVLSVDEFTENTNLRVYPNPTDTTRINIVGLDSGIYEYKVYDLNGRVLKKQRISFNKDSFIDIGSLSSGLYIMSLEGDVNGIFTTKFTVK